MLLGSFADAPGLRTIRAALLTTSALVSVAGLLPASAPAVAACTVGSPCVTAPENLGTLGGIYSLGLGVSSDGTAVAGYALVPGNLYYHAYRWTSATGMQDLGTLGGNGSRAYGISSDGAVVVGGAQLVSGSYRAFRWTSGTGMQNLGTLGGDFSFSYAANSDGSVVVGEAQSASSAYRAFRWTAGSGMVDLGTLGGTHSDASGVSSDGAVVVGGSQIAGNAAKHAFRWSSGSGMQDLGTLGGTNSSARATNADGSVVVGESLTAGNASTEAYRWTNSGGMQGLGNLGGAFSVANGVSADGAVVVGVSQFQAGNSDTRAFRWTNAGGMKNLNTLLTAAGVNMSGITLRNAYGISANGQFITGEARFSGNSRAYLVRYDDGGIAGLTDAASVLGSISELGRARLGVLAQQHGLASPLLGADKPIEAKSEVGVFAAYGSATAGGFLRASTSYGLSLLGGISYAKENYPGADIDHMAIGALAVQYVYGTNPWRPYVEAGGWYAPEAALSFSRTYANGAGTATGVGHTHGDVGYLYGRLGLIVDVTRGSQFAVSAEIGRERMTTGAYNEQLSAANPFEAHASAGTDQTDIAKARMQWSQRLAHWIDGTVWVAGVQAFNRTSDFSATVPGVGKLIPTITDSAPWVEYGARLGFAVTDAWTVDAFATGVSGGNGIDTRVHGGAALRFRF